MNDDLLRQEETDNVLERFSKRLSAILGSGRIRREDKAAKAEAAMVAVDELVDSLEEDLKF
jgi:hypothetical protein